MILPTLRARLLLVAGLGLLATLAVLGCAMILAQNAAVEGAKVGAGRMVALIADRYAAEIRAAHDLLLALSRIEHLEDAPNVACIQTLNELNAGIEGYSTLGVVGPNGDVLCVGQPLERPINVSHRPFWQRIIESRAFSLGDYRTGSVSGELVVVAALPRLSPEGELLRVLTVGITVQWFQRIAEEIALPLEGSLLLLDESGRVLAGTPSSHWHQEDDLSGSRLGRLITLPDSPERGIWTDEMADWIVGYGQLGPAPSRIHAVVVWDRDLVVGNVLWEWTLGPVLAGLLVIMIFVALAHWHWRTISRHLDRLLAAARAMSAGDFTARVVLAGSASDLEELANGFNTMAASLEARDQELRRQNLRLARSNVDLERFAYIASHDLQEPLRSISSFCELLERDYGERLDARGHSYLKFVTTGAAQMRHLVQDLLGYARLTSRDLMKTEVELTQVVKDAIAFLEPQVKEAGATIIHPDLPEVAADPHQLQRVLTNLIGNSIKYARSDQAPQVTIAAERLSHGWEIVYTDNGIGIPSHQGERIFEIFKRLHLQTEYPGTGVGLAEVRAVIERHGGLIRLDPEYPGPGSRFRFTLPDRGATVCTPCAPSAFAHPPPAAAEDVRPNPKAASA